MKVLLDLDKLRTDGEITSLEYDKLQRLGKADTGSLGISILIAFGVIATVVGTLTQMHSSESAIALGLVLMAAGVLLIRALARWRVLGSILTLVGALTASGGIIILSKGHLDGCAYAIALCAGGGLAAESGLLAALSVVAIAMALGAAATPGDYPFFEQRPLVAIATFGLSSWGAYAASLRLGDVHRRLAIMFARTALVFANLGFWLGSLGGDNLWSKYEAWSLFGPSRHTDIPNAVFAVVWAIALVATGIWALRRNRRWVVNALAVFGAIHFFTQYFMRMHATPKSLIVAGILALGIAFAIAGYNRSASPRAPERAHAA